MDINVANTLCITWNGAAPTDFEQLLPFILYAFHPTSPLPNTQEKLKDLLGKFIANGDVEDSSIYVCCDDFYYEFLKYYPSRRFAVETDLDLETIKQGYRTGQLIEPSELVGLNLPPLEVIDGITRTTASDTIEPDMLELADFRASAHKFDHFWELDDEKFIPPLDRLDSFVPTSTFYALVNLIRSELGEVSGRMQDGVCNRC